MSTQPRVWTVLINTFGRVKSMVEVISHEDRHIELVEKAAYDALVAENARLKALEIDHVQDMLRIQDAERECERLKAELDLVSQKRENIKILYECLKVTSYTEEKYKELQLKLELEKSEHQAVVDGFNKLDAELERANKERQVLLEEHHALDDEVERLKAEIEKMNDGRPSEWAYSILRKERDELKAEQVAHLLLIEGQAEELDLVRAALNGEKK